MSENLMKILTGNDLATGDVVWWAGDKKWSRHLVDAKDGGEQAEEILAREEEARRVNASYFIDGEMTDDGPMPLHIKDRVRASGPTVRPDLSINTDIPIVKA